VFIVDCCDDQGVFHPPRRVKVVEIVWTMFRGSGATQGRVEKVGGAEEVSCPW
jgi:hypothetical protein